MSPRDQANRFILALETELAGLGRRHTRKLLADEARAWAEMRDGGHSVSLRAMIEIAIWRFPFYDADRAARIRRALDVAEAAEQPGAVAS
jgi:hypothetical protein